MTDDQNSRRALLCTKCARIYPLDWPSRFCKGDATPLVEVEQARRRGPAPATAKFWLDGGYDFELVQACRLHPAHGWITIQVERGYGGESLTVCRVCGVPRCGTTEDVDRCTQWRHHSLSHIYESGAQWPVGGIGVV